MTDAPRGQPAPFGVGAGRRSEESFVQRRMAAEQRMSSSVRMAEVVDGVMRTVDDQLTRFEVTDADGTLRATVKAVLAVAYGVPEYDVAVAPARGRVAVRITRTPAGLEATVVELGRPP